MRFEINDPLVISETIHGETIVIHLGTGTYYSLDGCGAEVWAAVTGAASADEVTADLAARYGVDSAQVAPAVQALIGELQTEELIRPSAAAARTGAPADGPAAGPFVAPKLSRYTDMQDLVLLDPVHEVGETGWPEPKQEALGA